MSLHDGHLQKALQHAPDRDVAPSESTRKVVLDYADEAVKLPRESWFTRVIKTFNAWQIPRWQLTGMGSLAVSFLVVVMIWHENPDDPIQMATAPTEVAPQLVSRPDSNVAPAESSRDEINKADLNKAEQNPQAAAPIKGRRAPVVTSAEIAAPKAQVKMQDKTETNTIAKAKLAKQQSETVPQAATIEASSDKAAEASTKATASMQDASNDAGSVPLKERAASNETAPVPAPVAAAPVPIMERVPATAATAATTATTASSEASGDTMTKPAVPTNKTLKKMAEADARSEVKSDMSSAAAAKPALARNISLAQTISKEGGKALAIEDIQAGNLRILYLSKSMPAGSPLLDEVTGYRIELVADDAANLAAEVAAYNQTMRDWHLNQNN